MENGDRLDIMESVQSALVTIPKKEMEKAGIYMETEQEIHLFKSSGDGTVYPSAFSWKKNYSEEEYVSECYSQK